MPFLTEEIWHSIDIRENDIIVASWPESNTFNKELIMILIELWKL